MRRPDALAPPVPRHAGEQGNRTAKEYPIHVVTAWFGNTLRIALKHYLQVTDADFEQAAQATNESGTRIAQNAAQPGHAAKGGESQDVGATPAEFAAFAIPDDMQLVFTKQPSGEGGIRTPEENRGKAGISKQGGAESGAVDAQNTGIAPALATVIERWPTLSEKVRRGIVAMVRATK